MSDKKITGELFCSMVTEGALAIAEKKEQVNELNVFPVPDGDTGTNMSLTMASAMDAVAKLDQPTLGKAAETTASALLRGARGNSGVILSLLFRGVAKRLHDLNEADGCDFALALREGVEAAYKAVMKPAEGTILTVSRVAAQYAVEQCQAEADLPAEKVFEAILERGKTALEETVHQNPVLEKAGVVDAGGFGLLTIWEGMFDALRGIHKERAEIGGAHQGSRRFRRYFGAGHHLHLLHGIYRGAPRQGAQRRADALDPERAGRQPGRRRG